MRTLFASLLLVLTGAVSAQGLPVLSADAAAQALARGARVVDIRPQVRYQAGHLPGAVALDVAAVAADVAALQAQVSRLGIDLSREVVIVGEPGDPQALRLLQQLANYATGQVAWLVGGTHEWALGGRPLHTGVTRLPAVPQHLVQLSPLAVAGTASAGAPRMAGAALRDTPAAPAGAAVAAAYL